jgi:hypothetical protein
MLMILLTISAHADLIFPSTISINVGKNTETTQNMTITNTGNTSEAVTLNLIGTKIGAIMEVPNVPINVPANAAINVYYTIATTADTNNTITGTLIAYHNPQTTTIPVTISTAQTPQTGAGTITLNMLSPTFTAGNTILFEVTKDDYPVEEGKLMIIMGGSTTAEATIVDGYAFFNAPKTLVCPALVKTIISGYKVKSTYINVPTCVEYTAPQGTTSGIEFIPSTMDKKFEQESTNQLIINLRNSGTTKVKLISGTFSETRYSTKYGEQPIRLSTTTISGTQLESGNMIPIVFYIDTRGMPTGVYNTIFSISAEDEKGKTVTQTITPTITIIEKITNDSEKKLTIEFSDDEPTKGDTINVYVRADSTAIDSAKLTVKIGSSETTYYTPTNGKIPILLQKTGTYTFTAEKDGYTKGTAQLDTGTKQIQVSVNNPGIKENLVINITSDGEALPNTDVEVLAPDNKTITQYTTSSKGILYVMATQEGTYKVTAAKEGYETATTDAPIREKTLTYKITGDLSITNKITVEAIDENNNVLSASVEVLFPDQTKQIQKTGFELTLSQTGTYKLTAIEQGYTKTIKELAVAAKTITMTPTGSLQVGENILIEIKTGDTPLNNLPVEVTKPDNTIETLTTSALGKITLTPLTEGTYTVTAAKAGYTTLATPLAITAKTMTITLTYKDANGAPATAPQYGGNVQIQVTSGDKQLNTATIKNTLPDSSTTNSPIIPIALEGTYTVDVSLTGYTPAKTTFSVIRPLTIRTPPSDIQIGGRLTMQFSRQVPDVAITCTGTDGNTTQDIIATDAQGILTKTINSPGTCVISNAGLQYASFKVTDTKAATTSSSSGPLTIVLIAAAVVLGLFIIFKLTKRTKNSQASDIDKKVMGG